MNIIDSERGVKNMKNKKQYEWDRLNTYSITLKLNNKTDKEIINLLKEKDNKQKYIKELIKKDIENR